MKIFNLNKTIVLMPLMLTLLLAVESSVNGCSTSISKNSEGCDSKNIFTKEKKEIFQIKEEMLTPQNSQTNISRLLKSVKVNHKGKELIITRNMTDNKKSCPPFCIAPMNIMGVKTIGEIETLDFIKNLNEKGNSLILDTRESKYYKEGTIPGAFNLPSEMLQVDSKYFNDVIAILGIKKVANKWEFEEIHDLLIFDNGITDHKASEAIKSLLELSYPSGKILYYRGGFSSWKSLGLTLY